MTDLASMGSLTTDVALADTLNAGAVGLVEVLEASLLLASVGEGTSNRVLSVELLVSTRVRLVAQDLVGIYSST